MNRRNLGIAFGFAAVFVCAVLHVASFLMVLPRLSILVPVPFLAGAILCASPPIGWRNPPAARSAATVLGWILLIYAVLLFVLLHKTTGGATNVEIVHGQYAYMSKDIVIRPITEVEYKMFPTRVTRLVSAWMGMMATFCLSALLNGRRRYLRRFRG
jgi:hypothetical protein